MGVSGSRKRIKTNPHRLARDLNRRDKDFICEVQPICHLWPHVIGTCFATLLTLLHLTSQGGLPLSKELLYRVPKTLRAKRTWRKLANGLLDSPQTQYRRVYVKSNLVDHLVQEGRMSTSSSFSFLFKTMFIHNREYYCMSLVRSDLNQDQLQGDSSCASRRSTIYSPSAIASCNTSF